MLLSVFTRHSAGCRFSRDRACRRCNCPKWVGGQINGYYFRQSARTRQWAEAEIVRLELEEALAKRLPPFGPTHAVAEPSVSETPPPCVRRRYLTENRAIGLGKIKVVQIPTDYFPPDEFQRILDATSIYGDPRGGFIPVEDLRTRLRAMTLLMRWSGLRIRDAITLERHRLDGDSLLLYQAKTGTPVYVPLPPHVVEALEELPPGPKPNPRYFFWSGNGDPKNAVANWQRACRRLFELADIRRPDGEIKRCHPHMFRDTFAVEMLLAGVPIDQVSLLLGHASVKITEKSYAPFVKARQLQLQESVRNAWKAATGKGPQNTPPNSSTSVNKRAGWRLIHTAKKAKATA